jgi:hypothetical protein
MFKTLKRLIEFTKKDPKALEMLEKLSDEQLALVPDKNEGDGKAVFIGEGTHEEFLEFEKEEKGMKPWYERLKNLV